jgi:AcrR family transcriptional regulator
MATAGQLTAKGAATRDRIVEAAADLILARGVGGTSLDDIRLRTVTSKGQLFHYFPGGKSELVGAIATLQVERVFEAQRPFLDSLASWEEWDSWAEALLAHYAAQPHWGCPIGSLAAEVAGQDDALARELNAHLDRWRGYLETGVRRMIANGDLKTYTDPQRVALAIFASMQGGLLLTHTFQSVEPLAAALDAALATLRTAAA